METMLPKKTNVTSYHTARLQGQAVLQQTILHHALHILAEKGIEDATVRHLATTLQCSTKVLYTHFGSKEGLTEALYIEGFRQLRDLLQGVPYCEDVFGYFGTLSDVYWKFAHQNRNLYNLMFGHSFSQDRSDSARRKATHEVLIIVIDALTHFSEQQHLYLQSGKLEITAKAIWSGLHGVISLQLAGRFPEADTGRQLFDHTLTMLVQTLIDGKPKKLRKDYL